MSVKIHDIMHDVAQELAGKEIQINKFGGNNIGDEVRHWSYDDENGSPSSSIWTKLRSYIFLSLDEASWSSQLVLNQLKCLRVLELKHIDDIKSLESIGELLHLRYLKLYSSSFEAFPGSSITKLHNLQTFILSSCKWLRELPHDFSKLEKLVHIKIFYCHELQNMPSLSKLPYLKSLELMGLSRLQYMEKTSSFAGAEETPFFPSLEYLMIAQVSDLQGWFGPEVHHCQSVRRFPCLSSLEIYFCPETLLATFPACPGVKTLICHLEIVKQVVGKGNGTSCLTTLSLHLDVFDPTTMWEDVIIPWKALSQSLRTLILYYFGIGRLPKGMQHLTSLQTLKLLSCLHLKALPEWISCLTSLQDLQISQCSKVLYERCSEPSGADWPKIEHIPNIMISRNL